MNKYLLLAPLLILNFNIVSQESNDSSLEEVPSKLEQLIIDIESEIDVEKRFDFRRSNSKEKQLNDLKKLIINLNLISKQLKIFL